MVQLSHPYMTTGKTIALTIRTLVSKVMSLLFNILSRFLMVIIPRSKHLLISWLQGEKQLEMRNIDRAVNQDEQRIILEFLS